MKTARESRPPGNPYRTNSSTVAAPPGDTSGSEGSRIRTAFLNPFYVYSVVWSVVLALYSLGWSLIYSPLQGGLALFLIATVIVSALLGYSLQSRLASAATSESPPGRLLKHSKLITSLLVAGVLLEFAAVGQVPLFGLILKTGFNYGDFTGIPILHVALVTFSIFYTAYLAHHFTVATARKKLALGMQFTLLVLMFVLMLNRGAMLMSAFMLGILFLSRARLSPRRLVSVTALGAGVLYVFGCIGNLRVGLPYWDNSYIASISEVSANYPSWLPGQYLWIYMYLVSPLGNLNEIVARVTPDYNLMSMFTNLAPDFIVKRIFPEFDAATPLVVSYFNVSTGWASAWKFYGYIGLVVTYLALVVLVFTVTGLVRNSLQTSAWAITCGVVGFMFFTNALAYSGVSFALAFPVLSAIVRRAPRELSGRQVLTGAHGRHPVPTTASSIASRTQ